MAKPKRNSPAKSQRKNVVKTSSSRPQKIAVPDVDTTVGAKVPVEPKGLRSRFYRKNPAVMPKRLPSALKIAKKAIATTWEQRWLFLGIIAIYAAINLVLVQGLDAATNLVSLKEIMMTDYPGAVGAISTGFGLFAVLVYESNGSISDVLVAYQAFITVITSLAVIWTLRQVMASEKNIRIRDGFYKGMYPLVPFLLVVGVVFLSLLPLGLGTAVYSIAVQINVIANPIEQVIWSLPLILGAIATFYFLTTSILAAYIVTLPDMTPLKALRSARGLVRYRRLSVLRKLLFLPFVLLVASSLVMVPVMLALTALSPWFLFVLSMLSIVVVHAYLYTLYRELLA